MKKIVAWAVVCKDGEIHNVRGDKESANREVRYCDKVMPISHCAPHRIVKLVEERKKVSSLKGEK